jgi:hypothetical protein
MRFVITHELFRYSMIHAAKSEASDKFKLGDFGDMKYGGLLSWTAVLGSSKLQWSPSHPPALKKEPRQDSARLH